jgi:hypothetical protein
MASLSFIEASKLVELVQSANKGGGMYVRVVSANRLALGTDPMNPSMAIDLSRETVGPYGNGSGKPPEAERESVPKATRRSGEYWFEIRGRRTKAGSLRELLGQGLREIEAQCPGALEKLSHIKLKTKRIVSRDKKALFDSERLVDEFAVQLMDGWWYGINNNARETESWLERASGCAGLRWGEDFRTNHSEPVVVDDIFDEQ